MQQSANFDFLSVGFILREAGLTIALNKRILSFDLGLKFGVHRSEVVFDCGSVLTN